MKILVIEDETLAAERLINHIVEVEPSAEIASRLESVRSAIKWFSVNPNPDLIFMDVQLADGLCFEIFEKVKIEIPVIFTTAYNEYALKAFKVNSIDYLLKPIDRSELQLAIQKYKRLSQSGPGTDSYNPSLFKKVMEMINNPYRQRFVVRIGEHIKTVNCSEIAFFFSRDKSSFIRTSQSRDFGLDTSLDQIESELDPKTFFRVSRKQIVALEYIKDIIAYSGSRLKLIIRGNEAEEIIVSREKVSDFKLWLEGR
jgi:two-component system, LytTR family, response regulator